MKNHSPSKSTLMILIWDLGLGGIQKRVKDISLDLSQNYPKWQTILLVKNGRPRHFNRELENIPNITIKYFTHLSNAEAQVKKRSAIPWIMYQYLKYKPQTFLTFLSHFSFFAISLKIIFPFFKTKFILNEGAYTAKYLEIHTKYPILETELIRLLYRFADTIICPTSTGALHLHKHFWIPLKKLVVIKNWTLFKLVTPRYKPYWDLVFIGRLEKEKNLFELIDVIKQLTIKQPKLKMLIVGDGSLKSQLIKYCKTVLLNETITFLPTQKHVAKILMNSKIHITLSHNEGLPNIVIEAAACQIPSIISNFDGAEEVVIHGKTGYICKTYHETIKWCNLLISNKKIRTKLGQNAQKFIQTNFGQSNQDQFIKMLTTDK